MFTQLVAFRSGPLSGIGPFRQRLVQIGRGLRIRGAILLTPQGLRLSVVGPPAQVLRLLAELRAHPDLTDLAPQLTPRHHQPFQKLAIRVTSKLDDWTDESGGPAPGTDDSNDCLACLGSLLDSAERHPARGAPNCASGENCRHCGRNARSEMTVRIDRRHQRIRQAVTPLPGRQPFDNFKPIKVPPECDGRPLLEVLCSVVRHLSVSTWERECAQGRLLDGRHETLSADHVACAGDQYWHKFPGVLEPDVDRRVTILHEDDALVVLNKPAPLPMHAGGRFFRNTLHYILKAAYGPEEPHPAHRLDANTTGLVLVARNRLFAGLLQPQFARGRVTKRYLVQVQGQPASNHFHCHAPISAVSGEVGSRQVDPADGRAAHTEFQVIRRQSDGTTLLEARPHTGRTHQIRVHLWHLGFPVCGDPVYLSGYRLGRLQTLALDDPPLCLHAWRIGFVHPLTRQSVEFTAPLPTWIAPGTVLIPPAMTPRS